MLLGEPPATAYDVRFHVLGFPVRISAWFWLTGLLFGSNLIANATVYLPSGATDGGMLTPVEPIAISPLVALLLWTLAILVSILIHELGHGLIFRKHGMDARIVLYHFGGLAIPEMRRGNLPLLKSPWHMAEVSAAGPAFQIGSALGIAIVLGLLGYATPFPMDPVSHFLSAGLDAIGLSGATHLGHLNVHLFLFVQYYLLVSILWGVFNLLPIYPLDGGQITRALGLGFFGPESLKATLVLSLVVAALVGYTCYTSGNVFMTFMFASFAYSSFQSLQSIGNPYRP